MGGHRDVKVRNAKSQAKPYKITDGDGMFLLVTPSGSKYWRLKYLLRGKERLLALGVHPEVSLADAREKRPGRVGDRCRKRPRRSEERSQEAGWP